MKARIAASAVLAVGVALGTAGCNLTAPQATTIQYDPSDGVGATVGDISIRNAFVVSDDGDRGNLIVTVVNDGEDDQELTIQYDSAGGREDAQVSAPVGTTLVSPQNEESVEMTGLDTTPGSLLSVYFQYGTEEGKEVLLPVLTSALQPYSTLAPTDDPASTATPQVTSTPPATSSPSPEPSTGTGTDETDESTDTEE